MESAFLTGLFRWALSEMLIQLAALVFGIYMAVFFTAVIVQRMFGKET